VFHNDEQQAAMSVMGSEALKQGEVLRLRRFTTPTVYNGWERIGRPLPATQHGR
jgi:hypothetical protein